MKLSPKNALIFAAKLLAVTLVSFAVLEMIAFLSLSNEEKKLPAEKLLDRNHSEYLQGALTGGCSFAETVIGHSMLGFVHRQPEFLSEKCRLMYHVNNIGVLSDRKFPLTKEQDAYVIMVLGGSVAEQFANYKDREGRYYFEELLNKTFLSPTKKPFKVYNGGLGAWNMPNQLNMLMMYTDRMDALVSIDGYNEAYRVQEGDHLEEVPGATYILANESRSSLKILGLHFLWAYQYGIAHSILKHSYFFNSCYKILTGIYQSHILTVDMVDKYFMASRENLYLSDSDAREWSLKSLGSYIEKMHNFAKLSRIKSAQFFQPARFYGKELTEQEKVYNEGVDKVTFEKIDHLYQGLEQKKYPIHSLSHIFEKEKGEIFGDHIHYKKVGGISRGNEILAQNVVEQLGKMWGLKRKHD
jgi:hypothetical protein